jgi:DNA-binding MarR family transcriptional regulator
MSREAFTIQINLEDQLGFNITRVAILFRRELIRALSQYRMTPEQWQVMATLWKERVLCQKDIADLTLKDKHSVSRIIQRLERNGWVEKASSPEDGRSTLIKPTKKGWTIQNAITEQLINHFERISIDLGKRNGKQLLSLLKKLRRVLGDIEFLGS